MDFREGPIVNFESGVQTLNGAPDDEQAPHPQPRFQGLSRHGSEQWPQDDLRDSCRQCHSPNPGEPVKTAAAGSRQLAAHPAKQDKGQRQEPGQGGRAVPADRQAVDAAAEAQKNFRCFDAHERCQLVVQDQPELSVTRSTTGPLPLSGGSLQRLVPDCRLPSRRRESDQARPSAKTHAPVGFAGDLQETPYHDPRRTVMRNP